MHGPKIEHQSLLGLDQYLENKTVFSSYLKPKISDLGKKKSKRPLKYAEMEIKLHKSLESKSCLHNDH